MQRLKCDRWEAMSNLVAVVQLPGSKSGRFAPMSKKDWLSWGNRKQPWPRQKRGTEVIKSKKASPDGERVAGDPMLHRCSLRSSLFLLQNFRYWNMPGFHWTAVQQASV